MPTDSKAQRELAMSLLDKPLRFHHMPEDSEPLYVTAVMPDGMVEIGGMAGQFAPHLFAVKASQ